MDGWMDGSSGGNDEKGDFVGGGLVAHGAVTLAKQSHPQRDASRTLGLEAGS